MYNLRKIKCRDFYKNYLNLIQQLTVTGTCNYEQFKKNLKKIRKNSYIYVLEDESNKKILATGKLLIEKKIHHNFSNVGHIEDLVVDTNYRGKGYGTLILKKLIEKARKKNCYKIILSSTRENKSFYENIGLIARNVELSKYF